MHQPWIQVFDPLNSPLWSPVLAAVPIVLLLGLLATGRVSAHMAALIGLVAALLMAVFAYAPAMPGLSRSEQLAEWTPTVLAAAAYGAAFGLLPIGWIVLGAIFLYTLTVETGKFEIVKHSVARLSDDRRIQALLIAFSFGAFIEGAAGFGTPVAISAALMMGAGFRPLHAAGLALLANTSPVAFGALGTPTITLARVTGLDTLKLSAMAGRQLPLFSLLVPAWLVWVMAGWRGVVGVWPALVVCGGSFAVVQFLVANFHGPALVDVAGGIISLVCLALFLRVWQPREIFHFPEEKDRRTEELATQSLHVHSTGEIVSAWIPWVLLTIFVLVWGTFKVPLSETDLRVEVPYLHKAIQRSEQIAKVKGPEPAEYQFGWLSATGTGIFFAAIASAFWLRISPGRFLHLFARTCYRVRWALFTIACMLAIAFASRFSGMDATLGVAFTNARVFYPICAALLGWVGVALTGSDTSSNALFGSLQTITAERLAVSGGPLSHLSVEQAKILLATANSTGGVMGKMIDAQSIVVAAVATQQTGQEGPILRFVFLHSVILALLMGLLVFLQAYVWPWMIPE